MKKKKISVVIATYNGEKYLIEELKSIASQTIMPDEVIISDDCSKDNTCELVEKFISDNNLSNWKLYRNEINKGFSKNFMEALYISTGDIIFLADQDDIWLENKIEEMVSIFETKDNVQSVSSEFTFIDSNGNNILPPKGVPNTKCFLNGKCVEILPKDNLISSYIRGCTTCISREVVEYAKVNKLHNMSNNKLLGHDWILWMIASLLGKCYILNLPLLKYRFHDSNTSLEALQRKDLLGNPEQRIEGIRKSIEIHQFIFDNAKDFRQYDDGFDKEIKKCIYFEKMRLEYMTSKRLTLYLKLGLYLNKYFRYYRNFFGGVRVYIGDYLYANKRRTVK